MINRLLILFILFLIPCVALEFGNGNGIISSEYKQYKSKKQEFTGNKTLQITDTRYAKTLPDPYTKNYLELPQMNRGYKSKTKHIDFKTGKVEFFIFDSMGDLLPYELSYINKYIIESVALNKEQKIKVANKVKSLYPEIVIDESGNVLEDIDGSLVGNLKESNDLSIAIKKAERDYFGDNNDFSIDGTYELTTSEFALSVMTLDGAIINIPDSMLYNRIILNQGYSIREKKRDNEPTISELLGNTVLLFVFKVVTKLNDINLDLKLFVLGVFLPLSVSYTAFTKGTKYIQGISDFDDLIEKGIVGLIVLGLFYFSHTVHKNSEGEQFNQTTFQTNVTYVFKKLMRYADKGTNAVTVSYVDFQRNNIGVKSAEEFKNLYSRKVINNNILKYTSKVESICSKTYNIEKLEQYRGIFTKDGLIYPRTEDLYKKYKNKVVIGSEDMFYVPSILDKYKILSLSTCNENSKLANYIGKDQENINSYLDEIIDSNKLERNQKEINILKALYEESFKYSKVHGFIHAPFIMLIDSAMKTIHQDTMFNKQENRFTESQYNNTFDGRDAVNLEITDNTKIELSSEQLNYIFSNLPYMVIPPASSIKEVITDVIPTSFLSKVPFVGGLFEAGSKLMAMPLTVLIMQELIKYAPLVGITVVGLLVIIYFYSTVFIYTFASPYLVAFAFATRQTEKVFGFLKRGFIIAFKPILILLSIVIAIVVVKYINIMSIALVQSEFSLLMTIARDGMDFNQNSNISVVDIVLLVIKGTVALSAQLISLVASIYMILKGADIILSVLGVDDTSGVDIKEHVGQDIDSKNKLTNPGV